MPFSLDQCNKTAINCSQLIETGRGKGPLKPGQPSGLTLLKRCQLLRRVFHAREMSVEAARSYDNGYERDGPGTSLAVFAGIR